MLALQFIQIMYIFVLDYRSDYMYSGHCTQSFTLKYFSRLWRGEKWTSLAEILMMVTICFMEMLKVKGANGITFRLKDLFSFIGNIYLCRLNCFKVSGSNNSDVRGFL